MRLLAFALLALHSAACTYPSCRLSEPTWIRLRIDQAEFLVLRFARDDGIEDYVRKHGDRVAVFLGGVSDMPVHVLSGRRGLLDVPEETGLAFAFRIDGHEDRVARVLSLDDAVLRLVLTSQFWYDELAWFHVGRFVMPDVSR